MNDSYDRFIEEYAERTVKILTECAKFYNGSLWIDDPQIIPFTVSDCQHSVKMWRPADDCWECTGCGAWIFDKISSGNKCECGAQATVNNNCHSTWCPAYSKAIR